MALTHSSCLTERSFHRRPARKAALQNPLQHFSMVFACIFGRGQQGDFFLPRQIAQLLQRLLLSGQFRLIALLKFIPALFNIFMIPLAQRIRRRQLLGP